MSFERDVFAVLDSDLDRAHVLALLAVRRHYDASGTCSVSQTTLAETARMDRSRLSTRLGELAESGWIARGGDVGKAQTYRVTPPGVTCCATQQVGGGPVAPRNTPLLPGATPLLRHATPPVAPRNRSAGNPPTPPYDVLVGLDKNEAAVAANAHAPAPATPSPDFLAVERAYLDATGGGLMVKHVEASALKALTDTHGPAAVIVAIEEAVLANTRGRVSVNFVRAILEKRGQGGGTSPSIPRRHNEFRNAVPTEMRRLEGDEF